MMNSIQYAALNACAWMALGIIAGALAAHLIEAIGAKIFRAL